MRDEAKSNISHPQSQLIDAQISMTESVGNVVSAEIAEDIYRLKAELETRDKQMEEVRRRAEEIEINFREVHRFKIGIFRSFTFCFQFWLYQNVN